MTIFDIAIILFILAFCISGAKQGLIKRAVSLVGMILVLIIAFTFKEQLGNFFCKYLPFFKFSGSLEGLVSINVLIYQLTAFIIILSVLLGIYNIVVGVSKALQKLINATIILKLPSAIGGAVVGLVEGYLFSFIFLLLLVLPLGNFDQFANSTLVNTIVYKTPVISASASNITTAIEETYDLADQVVNEKISTNDANLKIIDSILKYKITTPHTIEQLVVLDKLEEVKGVDKVIAKYK